MQHLSSNPRRQFLIPTRKDQSRWSKRNANALGLWRPKLAALPRRYSGALSIAIAHRLWAARSARPPGALIHSVRIVARTFVYIARRGSRQGQRKLLRAQCLTFQVQHDLTLTVLSQLRPMMQGITAQRLDFQPSRQWETQLKDPRARDLRHKADTDCNAFITERNNLFADNTNLGASGATCTDRVPPSAL